MKTAKSVFSIVPRSLNLTAFIFNETKYADSLIPFEAFKVPALLQTIKKVIECFCVIIWSSLMKITLINDLMGRALNARLLRL